MKTSSAVLYPNETVAERVTTYSEEHTLSIPKYISDYHAHISESEKTSNYMISTFQAKAMTFLARLVGAKNVLEIGVYVGFSALVWSNAVGSSGQVTGLEFNQEYASRAEAAFKEHSVKNISIKVGDAIETLGSLDPAEPYDLVFIDAQKSGYPAYLRTLLEKSQPGSEKRLLKKGAVIIADNVLRRGLVADDSAANPYSTESAQRKERSEYAKDDDLVKIDEFNTLLNSSQRLEAWLLPLWDGVGLARLVD